MTGHAEDALRGTGIAQVLDLALAVPTPETVCTEGLVAGQNGQVFDLVPAMVAAICAVVADERAVAEQEEVRIRVEEGAACVATEAVDVPSVSGWPMLACCLWPCLGGKVRCIPSSKAFPSSRI
jgi:hypothetical protein